MLELVYCNVQIPFLLIIELKLVFPLALLNGNYLGLQLPVVNVFNFAHLDNSQMQMHKEHANLRVLEIILLIMKHRLVYSIVLSLSHTIMKINSLELVFLSVQGRAMLMMLIKHANTVKVEYQLAQTYILLIHFQKVVFHCAHLDSLLIQPPNIVNQHVQAQILLIMIQEHVPTPVQVIFIN